MVVLDDGLKTYLYGAEPLEQRLQLAKKAFLAPVQVSPVQKEDLIITWLSGLLTTKVFTLSPEEARDAWATMEAILESKRLKALCENKWICPLSSSFIETLVNLINSNYDENIQRCAVRVCGAIMANPSLAPSIVYSQNHCLTVTNGLIKWILLGHKSDGDIFLTQKIAKELDFHLKSQVDRKQAMQSVVDHILLPVARLAAALKEDTRQSVQNLISFLLALTMNFYENIFEQRFEAAFQTFFTDNVKKEMQKTEIDLFSAIASAISDEPVEVAEYLLAVLLDNFMLKYKAKANLHFQFFLILCYMIGVSPSKTSSVATKGASGAKFKPAKISQARKERLLSALLTVIESNSLHVNTYMGPEKLSNWIKKLTQKMLLDTPVSTYCYKSYGALLSMLPQNVANMLVKKFTSLICKKKKDKDKEDTGSTECAESNAAIYLAYEDLMCKILKVYDQLRDMPTLVDGLLQGLKHSIPILEGQRSVPESLIIYDGCLLLPPKFMLAFMKQIHGLSHNQILPLWTSVYMFASQLSPTPRRLLAGKNPGHKQFLSAVMWLYSCVLMASPVMPSVSVANFAPNLADMMKLIASNVIKPIVEALLANPHDNNACSSVLALCHTWGELHSNLISADVGYKECPDLPLLRPPEPGPATDFSYLLPFVPSDNWAQISARVANFGDKPTQLAMVQLVVQKFSQAAAVASSEAPEKNLNEHTENTTKEAMEGMTKYIINALETWGAPVAQMLTFHLTYILPYIDDAHLPSLAVYLVNGIREEQGSWKDYVKSQHFLEAGRLHPHVLAHICTVLGTLSNARKRKISESEDNSAAIVNKYSELMNILSEVLTCAANLESFRTDKETKTKIHKCGSILIEFMKEKDNTDCQRISSKEIGHLLDIIVSLPLANLQPTFQTLVLLILFTLLVQVECSGKTKKVIAIIDAINTTLCSPCKMNIFKVLSITEVFLWLVWKRASLPVAIVPECVLNLALPNMNFVGGERFYQESQKSLLNAEATKSLAYDYLFSKLLEKAAETSAYMKYASMADHIVDISSTASDVEPLLQIGVIFMSVCYYRFKKSMKYALTCLSKWFLKILKKLDLTTEVPATAACILAGHTVIIAAETLKPTRQKKKTSETEQEIKKTKRWQKMVVRTLNLASICFESGDVELKKYALTFLITVSHNALMLKEHVPDLFSIVWNTLTHTGCSSSSTSILQVSNLSLAPILSNASEDEYESWLRDLLTNTCEDNLSHSIALWKLVINSKVSGFKGRLKYHAMQNLTFMLLDMVSLHKADKKSLISVVVPALDILRVVLGSPLYVEPQVRALALTPCTTIDMTTLTTEEFKEVFMATLNLLSQLLLVHPRLLQQRLPSVMASINHLTILIIKQSNQDLNLNQDQIDIMVQCITGIERMVRNMKNFKEKLKRIVHFTTGNIVGSLQQVTVYPAVKTIVENIVYMLIDYADDHCLQHLLTAMPPATTELLKHLRRNYSSVHRFHPFLRQ